MKPARPRLLCDSLTLSASVSPSKEAIIARDASITYGDLDGAARRLAAALRARGVQRGDRVAIYMENSVEVAVAVYGALHADAAFMVVNPQTKPDKLKYVLADSEASVVISDPRLTRSVDEVAEDLANLRLKIVAQDPTDRSTAHEPWHGLYELLEEQVDGVERNAAIPPDLAALIYTSGSTGNPKGVMLSHQNMVFAQESIAEYLRLTAEDRIINVLPLAFDYGLYQLLMSVHIGATLVLEKAFAFPMATVNRVNEMEVTFFPGVPTVFASLLALHRKSPLSMPTVRAYTNTAAHLPDDYVSGLEQISPGALVFKMYGLTECKRVSYLEPEIVMQKPSSVGKAIPGTEVYLLDENGREVSPGQTGVLFVRGPHVMMGYWNLPAETAYMIREGKYPGERVLCTHDFFRVDEDGFLYFVGRSDDIIKSRGEKVSPVEVENAIASIPGVRECAVIGVDDEVLGQAIRAYVVADEGGNLTESELKRRAMERLEGFMVPRDVVFVAELPKTATGKVRKKSLEELA